MGITAFCALVLPVNGSDYGKLAAEIKAKMQRTINATNFLHGKSYGIAEGLEGIVGHSQVSLRKNRKVQSEVSKDKPMNMNTIMSLIKKLNEELDKKEKEITSLQETLQKASERARKAEEKESEIISLQEKLRTADERA